MIVPLGSFRREQGKHLIPSDSDSSTTPGTDRAAARDHRGPDRLVADAELRCDLGQCQTVCVEPGGVLTDRVMKLWVTSGQPRLPSDLAHRAAVHLEPCRKLLDRHPRGVPVEQFGSIGDTQTGLRLTRIFSHRTTLIGDPSTPGERTSSTRSP